MSIAKWWDTCFIRATTTIKLIELNKKNNYKIICNVFATAIYRHSRILLRTDDHFPIECQLNQFQLIVSCISTVITRDGQFRPKTRAYFGVESFIDNFIGLEKAYKPGY